MAAICSKWSVDVAKDRSDVGEQSSTGVLRSAGLSMLYSVKERKHVLCLSPYGRSCQVPSDTVKKHIYAQVVNTGSGDNPDFKDIWDVISSANLLYRLCCLSSSEYIRSERIQIGVGRFCQAQGLGKNLWL